MSEFVRVLSTNSTEPVCSQLAIPEPSMTNELAAVSVKILALLCQNRRCCNSVRLYSAAKPVLVLALLPLRLLGIARSPAHPY